MRGPQWDASFREGLEPVNTPGTSGSRRHPERVLIIVGAVILSGCSEPLGFLGVEKMERQTEVVQTAGSSFNSLGMTQEGILDFSRRINRLAESELARMNTAELMYRDTVYRHTFRTADTGDEYEVYAKVYRRYSGFELLDLKRSESQSKELSFRIRFNSEILTSEARYARDAGSLEGTRRDSAFDMLGGDAIVQTYPMDRGHFRSGYLPPAPERPAYHLDSAPDHVLVKREPVSSE